MPITQGSDVYYQDLVQMVIITIKTKCQNIDEISSAIPTQLKNGYSRTINTIIKTEGTGTHTPKDVNCTATIKLEESLVKVVTHDIVEKQFSDFMKSRGISNKPDTLMNVRGIVNFIANAASFIKAKVVSVSSSETDYVATVYNPNNTGFPAITSVSHNSDDDTYTKLNLNEMIKSLNVTDRFQSAIYNVSIACCSSSSSSCSSSSSSSSSSVFIAYMRI